MKATQPWILVAQRELMVRLRDKTFIGSTLLTLVLIVGVFGFQAWSANQDDSYDLVVTSQSQEMGQTVAKVAPALDDSVSIDLTTVKDTVAGEAAVKSEKADALLTKTDKGWQLTGKSEVPESLETVATQAISQSVLESNARSAGTDLATMQAGSTVSTDILDGDADKQAAARGVGTILAVLFYMAAVVFGMYLAMSVTEEKQSRIVEIIATSISLRQLLFGKLAGSVTLAVGQILLYAVVAIVGVSFTDLGGMLPGLTSGLIWYLAFFLTGFTLVAALYAVAGALASRQEDIQSTSLPVTMVLMAVFFGALFAKGQVVDVLAWVPPFSAVLQPMRLVSGEGQWWEALISLGVLAATTAVVVLFAERIYRRALMQTSGKLGYRQAWKAEI